MEYYPYDASRNPPSVRQRDSEITCPLCGIDGGRWEYGVKCYVEFCPAEEISSYPDDGAIEVRVDGDALASKMSEYGILDTLLKPEKERW